MSKGFLPTPRPDTSNTPMASNPFNLAMSPCAGHPGTCYSDKQWKKEKEGVGEARSAMNTACDCLN